MKRKYQIIIFSLTTFLMFGFMRSGWRIYKNNRYNLADINRRSLVAFKIIHNFKSTVSFSFNQFSVRVKPNDAKTFYIFTRSEESQKIYLQSFSTGNVSGTMRTKSIPVVVGGITYLGTYIVNLSDDKKHYRYSHNFPSYSDFTNVLKEIPHNFPNTKFDTQAKRGLLEVRQKLNMK